MTNFEACNQWLCASEQNVLIQEEANMPKIHVT